MHILIAVITAIAGLIWALNSLQRAGFDLNSLNPWYWARRKRWEEKQINPLYSIETPRELAAVLMFAALKQGGDPTAEQKTALLGLYARELKYADKECNEMYALASHLISTDPNYTHKVRDLVAPARAAMSEAQRASIPDLVRQVTESGGEPNATQRDFVAAVEGALAGARR